MAARSLRRWLKYTTSTGQCSRTSTSTQSTRDRSICNTSIKGPIIRISFNSKFIIIVILTCLPRRASQTVSLSPLSPRKSLHHLGQLLLDQYCHQVHQGQFPGQGWVRQMLRTHFRINQGCLRRQDYPEVYVGQAALQTQSKLAPMQLMSEIKIHESLNHANVVKFLHNF